MLTTSNRTGFFSAGRRRSVFARQADNVTTAAVFVAITIVGVARLQVPDMSSWGSYHPVAVFAGLFLRPGRLALAYAYLLAWSIYADVLSPEATGSVGALIVLLIVMAIMYWVARSRARLGVQGLRGENLLVDLRDRLATHGQLPELPRGWRAEAKLDAAYGEGFSGDFIVANRSTDGRFLEVAVVDVSGKGAGAGSRSLMLSGALGGLLGSMESDRFLPAANSYLLRQNWREGFATAVHLTVDMATGEFSVGSAGHPPAVWFSAGSGRWEAFETATGPLLGVIDEHHVDFQRSTGVLGRGDAIMLYTDGVIESRGRDLRDGIDRMLGAAERLISRGFAGMAEKVVAAARAGENDDRAVVVVWRE